MNNTIIKIGIFSVILFLFFSCSLEDERIKNHYWKYGEGYHLVDVLVFDENNVQLKNDTISRKGKKEAVIIKKEWKFPIGYTNRIYIQSIETGEIGSYHEK